MHWRIKGRQSWRVSFCGGLDGVEGHKGREHYWARKTTIHRSAIENTTSHKGADNGKNTMKGNGDGVAWSVSGSKETMCNFRHNYTFKERH